MEKKNKNYSYWINNAPKEIVDIIKNYSPKEIDDHFGNDIDFGTAGMRGKIDLGTNYINIFTLSRAVYGFGKLVLKKYGKRALEDGVVIAHDNRRMRYEFSMTTARILSALGIKVFLFPKNNLQPTPLLSFTIAQNKFVGGINITASHNPPTDNGFKVYNEFGFQCEQKDTDFIKSCFKNLDYFKIKQNEKNIFYLEEKYIDNYFEQVMEHIPFDKNVNRSNLKITFTSNHGTARDLAVRFAKAMKVKMFVVEKQSIPDENFTYSKTPNPQSLSSYDMAIEEANKNGSNLIFATDPDADRFGIMVKEKNKWIHIDGNQLPIIQLIYKIHRLKLINAIKKTDFIVTTFVTSNLGKIIAKDEGIKVYETLTGFKWIILKALALEKNGNNCIFAWEESYGSVIRTFTRDKDSFQALVQVIELYHYYQKQGVTLTSILENAYKKYGHYDMFQVQKKFEGNDGHKKMISIIEKIRNKKLKKIGNYKISKIIDFKEGYKKLPKQNFLIFYLENGSFFCLRPSGTEPVLRLYFDLKEMNKKEIEKEVLALFK